MGIEATERLRNLIEGKWVEIESDGPDMDDQFGYLLRYVYLNGNLVNYVMLREGFATIATRDSGIKLRKELDQAQHAAQNDGLGLWSHCEGRLPDG